MHEPRAPDYTVHLNHLGDLIKIQILIRYVWGRAQKSVFLKVLRNPGWWSEDPTGYNKEVRCGHHSKRVMIYAGFSR